MAQGSGNPVALLKNTRSSPSRVTSATGAPSSREASRVSRSNASSGGLSRRLEASTWVIVGRTRGSGARTVRWSGGPGESGGETPGVKEGLTQRAGPRRRSYLPAARYLDVTVRLLPRDEKFFDLFTAVATFTVEAARLQQELLRADHNRRGAIVDQIKRLEHQADQVTHDVVTRLDRVFITPLDREDIHAPGLPPGRRDGPDRRHLPSAAHLPRGRARPRARCSSPT